LADADLDPDPGSEKFADPDPGLHFYKKNCVYLRQKSQQRYLSQDQNANPDPNPGTQENGDPDPWTQKMRIQCGSGSETLVLDHKDLNVFTGFRSE